MGLSFFTFFASFCSLSISPGSQHRRFDGFFVSVCVCCVRSVNDYRPNKSTQNEWMKEEKIGSLFFPGHTFSWPSIVLVLGLGICSSGAVRGARWNERWNDRKSNHLCFEIVQRQHPPPAHVDCGCRPGPCHDDRRTTQQNWIELIWKICFTFDHCTAAINAGIAIRLITKRVPLLVVGFRVFWLNGVPIRARRCAQD